MHDREKTRIAVIGPFVQFVVLEQTSDARVSLQMGAGWLRRENGVDFTAEQQVVKIAAFCDGLDVKLRRQVER